MTRQEQMYSLIEEQKQSGLTINEFCKQREIPHSTFKYWRGKQNKSLQKQSPFIPVKTTGHSATQPSPVEVHYPGGITVRLEHFNMNQITSLIKLGNV